MGRNCAGVSVVLIAIIPVFVTALRGDVLHPDVAFRLVQTIPDTRPCRRAPYLSVFEESGFALGHPFTLRSSHSMERRTGPQPAGVDLPCGIFDGMVSKNGYLFNLSSNRASGFLVMTGEH